MREEFSGGVGGARRWEEGGEDVWRREEQVGRGVCGGVCTQGVVYAGRGVRRAWCMINNPHLIECGCNGCETR